MLNDEQKGLGGALQDYRGPFHGRGVGLHVGKCLCVLRMTGMKRRGKPFLQASELRAFQV